MRLRRITLTCIGLCWMAASAGLAQTTQPTDPAALELRATQALNSGKYDVALPILEKLVIEYRNQPERAARLEEQIRVCRNNLATNAPPVDARATAAGEMPPTDEARKPHLKPVAGQTIELTIKELGNFEYDSDRGGNVPEDVKALSGTSIRVRGFMIPMDQADKITQFALVPDLFACCYGQPPQIQHMVMVNVPAGKEIAYFPDEIVVEGTLNVEEKKEEEYIVSLFELAASSVKPAAK